MNEYKKATTKYSRTIELNTTMTRDGAEKKRAAMTDQATLIYVCRIVKTSYESR